MEWVDLLLYLEPVTIPGYRLNVGGDPVLFISSAESVTWICVQPMLGINGSPQL